MFSIHISEKNGTSHSETFDKPEITVGRVQGNDLMLPRGNVSKRHARFLHRDGRFIVTDLKSTNGTYVNGRRIAHATIVREGDSVHVGDYELRLGVSGRLPKMKLVPAESPATQELPGPRPDSGAFAPPSITPPNGRSWLDDPPARDGYGRALGLVMSGLAPMLDSSGLAIEASDDAFLDRLFAKVTELAQELRDAGQLASDISAALLFRDVHRELFELGPLGPLLDDPSISEIQVLGHDRVLARSGSQSVAIEPAFSSETAVSRVLDRLARQSGEPLASGERAISRLLPGGVSLQAFLRPTALSGPVLVLRKPNRSELDLDDLVRDGMLSRNMAAFLSQALAAGANLLLAAPSGETSSLALALARKGGAVLLYPPGEPETSPEGALSLSLPDCDAEGAKVLRSATRFGAERIFVSPFAGPIAAALLEAIAEGASGVVASLQAPSLHRGLERCMPSLVAARPGLSGESAREWVAASFDLVVEVVRLRDGRERLRRIAEPVLREAGDIEIRDIFVATGDGFTATGIVPRIADESALGDGGIDASLFQRN